MISKAELSAKLEDIWESRDWFSTIDHKKIGKRYLVTALVFLLIGGVEALLMRMQLAQSDLRVLTPEQYNQMFTMHGVTMIFWYASPILSGFSNYLIPLMIGARDMAFPRVNAFSYWTFLLSGAFLYASPFVGSMPHGGWFAYPPYTSMQYSPGLGMDFYALALIFLTVSTTAGAINLLVTIIRLRAPGMTLSRMPLFLFSSATTSFAQVFCLPALSVACIFLELERRWGFHFFQVRDGGDPILWQHLFWFFGHPWVYVIFLPATGMISMLLPVFARRPIVGHHWVASATVLTGLVGFAVWVHHMFAIGPNNVGMSLFAVASMVISVFSTIQVFAWIATLWLGKPVLTTSMWFALGFLANFIIGGLSGVITAIIPFDWQVHDTYFVVTHLHYVLVGANVFPVLAGLYYWFPKMSGKLPNEKLGVASFACTFIGFNVAFFPMHVLGLLGMPRRIYTYAPEQGWDTINLVATMGAGLLAVGIFLTLWNLIQSRQRGEAAGDNPWNADTLEWDVESPPPSYGSVHLPTVITRNPLWDAHDEEEDPDNERVLAEGRFTLSTTPLDAIPVAAAQMPEDTLAPLVTAVALAGLFSAFLLHSLIAALVAAIVTLGLLAYWLWPQRELKTSRPLDHERGVQGMWWLVGTEAALFVMLLFSYFYVHDSGPHPKRVMALIMLAVLVLSSIILHLGEKKNSKVTIAATLLLGVAFIVLQALEYHDRLKEVTPQDSAYGSLFYTITGIHGLHVILGLCMLAFLLAVPLRGHMYKIVSRYWHFVDVVWISIVACLYIACSKPDRGRELVMQYSCGACHTIPGIRNARGVFAPPLTAFAQRAVIAGEIPNTPENLVRWLMHPHAINARTAMPELDLSEDQARDIAAYLYRKD